MVEVKIEKLHSKFCDDLVEIDRQCSTPPWNKIQFESEFNSTHSLVLGALARDSKRLIGFIILHHVAEEAEIANFGVCKELRRQSVGRLLLETCIEIAKGIGVKSIGLDVRESNLAALSLYREIGFQQVGLRKGYYSSNGEAAILMTKQI